MKNPKGADVHLEPEILVIAADELRREKAVKGDAAENANFLFMLGYLAAPYAFHASLARGPPLRRRADGRGGPRARDAWKAYGAAR